MAQPYCIVLERYPPALHPCVFQLPSPSISLVLRSYSPAVSRVPVSYPSARVVFVLGIPYIGRRFVVELYSPVVLHLRTVTLTGSPSILLLQAGLAFYPWNPLSDHGVISGCVRFG